ncbi:hypothetical protein D3C72_1575740 [compost metagenome]
MMHRVTIGAGSASMPSSSASSFRSCHSAALFWYCSISLTHFFSFGAHSDRARPFLLPRPVRPMRWMCTSVSFDTSTLITAPRSEISRPRAATSVATSTEQLRLANSTRISSRSRCSSSPYRASAEKPCWRSSSASSRQCTLVLQKASVDSGLKCFNSLPTALLRSSKPIS